MARATWTGFLSFGLVSVPVGLYAATVDQTVHFNQLRKGTSHRIRYKKVDEVTGEEVASADIVNGYDLGDGEFVVVSREELKEAAPGRSETIEISDFVDLDRIDPTFFRQTYYLGPRGKGADRAYALLLQAMQSRKRVGIATLVLRDKEHLVAVRPGKDVLILETMYFADEIRDAHEQIDNLPKDVSFRGRELQVAEQLIESLTAEWSPSNYRNTYRERVEAVIEEKRRGRSIVFPTEQPKSNVVDLMSVLEASLARSAASRGADTEKAGTEKAGTEKAGTEKAGTEKAGTEKAGTEKAGTEKAGTSKKRSLQARAPAGEQQSFDGMSKAELLERAAELDVQGRSKMSKLQLVEALTESTTPRRRGRRVS